MVRKQVLVLGSNFGGLTAALAVKHELHGDVDVTVISPSDHFVFNPSLIWLPFGKRRPADITFPVTPTFETHGIEFVHAPATHIDPVRRQVTTPAATYAYDYLVVATGYRNDGAVAPGLTPENRVFTITTLDDAITAGEGWQRFLDEPGPVLIGATQGAGCFGAAYEFLFNMAYRLRKAGLTRRAPLTFVTPEPFLGHFGVGGMAGGRTMVGMFMKRAGIRAITDVAIEEAAPGKIRLTDDETVEFNYAMIVPPFLGQPVVRTADALADGKGYIPVRDTYQSAHYDDVYAVGIAAAVPVPWQTAHPVSIPKTGFPTETMAHIAARNIAAQITGRPLQEHKEFAKMPAVCVLDAGNNGVIMLADHMLPPRRGSVLIPGPQAHALKLAFEKYFLWKARHGYVTLP